MPEVLFQPRGRLREKCGQTSRASRGKSVKAEFIWDKHIFRLGKKSTVNKDIGESVYAVKIQKHVGIGFLFQIKFGKITDMGVLVILRGKNIGAEI